ncbi:MAG: class I SAM-dependent methyltransferase [Planctomycetota bacterium]|nr:MAG: class I SAM-dependent methyltransferase [Planctomycetota bacterium]
MTDDPRQDVRFAFGENWRRFLRTVDEARIAAAVGSLQTMLERGDLNGLRFLDVGCGSGLFSLAARRLGARVTSFDVDPQSVACTRALKWQFAPGDADWTILEGSVLDATFVKRFEPFDVVYSWGVLHHTGAMWEALENVCALVAPDGYLCVAIYNDQGGASRRWAVIKRTYNAAPAAVRWLMAAVFFVGHEARQAMIRAVRLKNPLPFRDWAAKKRERGMSPWHDAVDWIGGYPFEVAKPEEVFDFVRQRGFCLTYLRTQGGGYGCNEFTFRRHPCPPPEAGHRSRPLESPRA